MAPGPPFITLISDEILPPPGGTYTNVTPSWPQEQQINLTVTNTCGSFPEPLLRGECPGPYVGPRRQLTPAERQARRLKRKAGRKSRRHNRRR